ncbi:reverse transcriptase domain-containing protein, partial [Acinetobacter baumannii]|uniref:reverse transcriptase domain-containing protein n=1 Tax=Acinetobacter baumannii TaxID=470 RepID=UPI0033926654
MSVAWLDFRKAFETVSHSWINRVLQASRFPAPIVRAIQSTVSLWSTKLELKVEGRMVSSDTISFTRGILQGDALSPYIFCLCTSPIGYLIDQLGCGYTPGSLVKRLAFISHSYYKDDLKLYCQSAVYLQKVLQSLGSAFDGLGFVMNAS